jgi:transcription initiation factor TFIIB
MSLQCHFCKSAYVLFDYELQAYVCSNCGTVLEDKPVYMGAESIDKEGEKVRYSGAFTQRVHDHGVGSTEISGSLRRHIKEGRTWVARNIDARVDKEDKKVVKALRDLNELIKQVKPPKSVAETAAKILRSVSKDLNVKEQTLKKIVVASLYLAYKVCGVPRPARVFAKELGIKESDLWEGVRKIREVYGDIKVSPEAFEPRYYVNYIAGQLKMQPEIPALASELLSNVDKSQISGKSPASLAAAAVYLAGILLNNRKNQVEVGSVIGQTDVAIRSSYDTLIKLLDIEVFI